MRYFLVLVLVLFSIPGIFGQNPGRDFEQMQTEWPTPNDYRTASGAPGQDYWQQRADYVIDIILDDKNQKIYGKETVTYINNSPDDLSYIWLQLDQNNMSKDSESYTIESRRSDDELTAEDLRNTEIWFDGGFELEYVRDASGKSLPFTVNKTMMRIDLPQPLRPGGKFVFSIKWWYNINDRMKLGGRSGYEYFSEEDNYLYTIAQFFPRMAVYCDNEGWQHKQFLGAGEFTLNFGDYQVSITVPADHVVAATGTLQNPNDVLSKAEIDRLNKAKSEYSNPVIIVSEDEAREKEKSKSTRTKTWKFKAENVRDFAFASSRKFIWDALAVKVKDKSVLAMSYYPKEGNPLWEQYSTKAVKHTLEVYSRHTIDYPYPVAISVHTNNIGMEYPMICFNGGRPNQDGTYSERTKYGMITVIIHEVGHNFFPMIINSDERQWTWMDEGLNTFCQYLAEKEWDRNYPTRRGPARNIVDYMAGDQSRIEPIMTNSESISQFGNNAYGKPATALNILRETIMGRELFDYAFKEYARRWAFKHPTPADFFRTMEDASSVDLDWFWRGWFYGTKACDMSLKEVNWFNIDSKNPEVEMALKRTEETSAVPDISLQRDITDISRTYLERDSSLHDFYTQFDPHKVTGLDITDFDKLKEDLNERDSLLLNSDKHYYEITFENVGGLVMPLIVRFHFVDGTAVTKNIPAEIWKMGHPKVVKVFAFDIQVASIELDPMLETADIDLSNNHWPSKQVSTRFDIFKKNEGFRLDENPMQRAIRENKK